MPTIAHMHTFEISLIWLELSDLNEEIEVVKAEEIYVIKLT